MTLPSNKLPPWIVAALPSVWMMLVGGSFVAPPGWLIVPMALALAGAVFAVAHHAGVVAHRVGEPFGTLILAIAMMVIEVTLIVSVVLSSGPEKAGLAYGTMFVTIMLICNGIVGACLSVDGLRHRGQAFQASGATAALAMLAALITLTMALSNCTSSALSPVMTPSRLAFAKVTPLVLYDYFAIIQTIRHRDYLLAGNANRDMHAPPPSVHMVVFSAISLMASLVVVVGLVKILSSSVETATLNIGTPSTTVGIVIAALVPLPECLTALHAANTDRIQTSLNLTLGSALVSISLTIPAVATMFIQIGRLLELGLSPEEVVLLFLALIVSLLTLDKGHTTILQGIVRLAVPATYLFLSIVP